MSNAGPTTIVTAANDAVAIVAEDLAIGSALHTALAEVGLTAHFAGTLPCARKLLGIERPAVLVLDNCLEGGVHDFVAEIRREGVHIPVVIVSAGEPSATVDDRTIVLEDAFDVDRCVAAVLASMTM